LLPRNYLSSRISGTLTRVFRAGSTSRKAPLELLAEGFNIFNRFQVTNMNATLYNLGGSTLTVNLQTITELTVRLP
jgi:hypothetical protein